MKQFLFLITILLVITDCKYHEDRTSEELKVGEPSKPTILSSTDTFTPNTIRAKIKETLINDFSKREYYYTPQSFAFTPYNTNYHKVVSKALWDSLKIKTSQKTKKLSNAFESVANVSLSNNYSAVITYRFYFVENEFLDALIEDIKITKNGLIIPTKSVQSICKDNYEIIENYINKSRKNLFELIDRYSPPHISRCKKAGCPVHKTI